MIDQSEANTDLFWPISPLCSGPQPTFPGCISSHRENNYNFHIFCPNFLIITPAPDRRGKREMLASLLQPLSSVSTLYLAVTTQVTIGSPGDGAWSLLMTANGQLSSSMCDCQLSQACMSSVSTAQHLTICQLKLDCENTMLCECSHNFLCLCFLRFWPELDNWLGAGDSNRKWIPDNGDTWLAQAEWGVTATQCHATKVNIVRIMRFLLSINIYSCVVSITRASFLILEKRSPNWIK